MHTYNQAMPKCHETNWKLLRPHFPLSWTRYYKTHIPRSLKAAPNCRYSWSLKTWAKCLIFCVSWTTASTTELSCRAACRQWEQLAGAGGPSSPNISELPWPGTSTSKTWFKTINMISVQSWITAAELKGSSSWVSLFASLLECLPTEGNAEGPWSKIPQLYRTGEAQPALFSVWRTSSDS